MTDRSVPAPLFAPDRALGGLLGWRRLLVAIVAGAASALALAPVNAFPVLWLTMPVLIWLLDGAQGRPDAGPIRRLAPAFSVGWGFGFGYFVGGLWWIGVAFLAESAEFVWLMPFGVLLLPAGLALFWGFGAAIARLFWLTGWRRILVFAVVFSLTEWLRGHVLTGFPWNAFGYTLMPVPVMMQIASVVGLWGVTLLAFLVFAAPALVIGRGAWRRVADRRVFLAIVALFLADIGFGVVRLAGDDGATVPGVALRLVQPMIPQDEKWAPGRDDEVLDRYLSLSATGMEEGKPAPFTVLIWPETALPFFLADRPNALAAIGAVLPPGSTLLTGAARAEPVLGEELAARVFNSIFVIDSDGVIRDAYDKVHLVPFGEYLPFEALFSRLGLRQMVALPGGFDAGRALRTMSIPNAPSFGPLICYEIIFPGAAVDGTDRPRWLVNVTNDAWFGDTPGPRQHFHQAVIRAVEEGLPLVRAANSGISGIVDAYGKIISQRSVGSVGIVDGPLPDTVRATIYSRFGDRLYFGLIVAAIIAIVAACFTQTKARD
ncbi:apolipoprotein N-acyltransferase [Kaistia dalseonensis]|uniref:Apolipoprotein N-acyltransferase n=1 Tax=Kaistia dalseonensis TaxID=410840 RepID=A0ABU0H6I5_9HYPH|nr:apolipoprotein N-acyltransferase [Kaistia dalseonensis]MCX5494907.1 apolipoprotein N-acyltransferase [Kaistia dalseonensis]MDQ0437488.1 apolipoprotein N-acyltransferase [Kaistia dalseonensis]